MPSKKPRDRAKVKRTRKTLLDVTTDDAFFDDLAEAAREEGARAKLKTNPKSHLREKGRHIPDEISVEFMDDHGTWGIRLSFDEGEGRGNGFDVRGTQGEDAEAGPGDRGRYHRLQRELHDLLTDDRYLDAVESHEESESAHGAFKADPKGQLEAKGLSVPDEVEVEVSVEVSNPSYQCWHRYCYPYRSSWGYTYYNCWWDYHVVYYP